MKVRCEYCNNLIDDGEEKCPGCGAINKDYKRSGIGVPTTIDELKQWYNERGLPPYITTRFFIGIDYKEPKAFGIYKDDKTGKFIVYKNKDTGERAIRYEGTDEKYAVNELYLKLKDEIAMRKNANSKVNYKSDKKSSTLAKTIAFVFLGFFALAIITSINTPSNGYYNINGDNYYKHGSSWYIYENNDCNRTNKPDYDGDISEHYNGDYYTSGSDYTDIRESDVYDSSWDSSDWDSDSDWDSGSDWDSSDSDWGSDW